MAFSLHLTHVSVCARVSVCVCWFWGRFITFCSAFPSALIVPAVAPRPLLPCADNCQGFHGHSSRLLVVFCVRAVCVSLEVALWALSSSVILHRAHLAWSRKGTSDRNHETLPLEVGIGSHTGVTLCCHWSSSVFTLISTCHVQRAWHFVSLCLFEQGLWNREPSIG